MHEEREGRARPGQKKRMEAGSTVGNRGEPSADTVPDRQPDDERLSANEAQSSGGGKADDRIQGRDDEWPRGHRSGGMPRRTGVEQPR
jgi:antitoxin (DNA-binding transcriptional repressor) of toxin-antitoxin stability system